MVDVPLRHKRDEGSLRAADIGWLRRHVGPFVAILFLLFIVLSLGWLVRIAIDTYRESLTLTGLSDDPRPVLLAIAGERLSIPANMIRFAKTRRGGPVESAELAIHWPMVEGYSEKAADDFKEGSPAAAIVFATVTTRDSPLDSTARLDAVYARFFTGKPVAGPTGLVGRRLVANSGYDDEIVFFVPGEPRPFVARCMAGSTAEVPAICLRDFNFGRGLSMLYRFNRALLDDWRALDTGLRALAVGFATPQP